MQEKKTTLSIENYNDAKPIFIAPDYKTVPSSLTSVTENKFDVASLKNAVREGESLDTINLLIKRGVNLDNLEASDILPRDGENSINSDKIIKLLLKKGLNPNVILKRLYSTAHIYNYGPIIFSDIEIVNFYYPASKMKPTLVVWAAGTFITG